METNKTQFTTGNTYGARSICDSDCIFKFEVIKRTEKSIWLKDLSGMKKGVYRVKVTNLDSEAETCSPLGNYSMSPILRANSIAA